jgi:hypothetical protein
MSNRGAQARAKKALSGGLPSRELGQRLHGRTCAVPRKEPFSIVPALTRQRAHEALATCGERRSLDGTYE